MKLDRLLCFLGRHDDTQILFESGKPWKVYCCRCERVAIDLKGYLQQDLDEEEKLRIEMRKALSEGKRLVANIMPSGAEKIDTVGE